MSQKPAFEAVPRIEKRFVIGSGHRVSERLAQKKGEKDLSEEDVERRKRLLVKLAFLEKKVGSIAFDIKKAMDMLNGDTISKIMLSDIEEKILEIEQKLGYAGSGSVNDVDNGCYGDQTNEVVGGRDGSAMSKMTALNQEELEKRLFPHQRLLMERKFKSDQKENENLEPNVAIDQISMQSVAADNQDSVKREKVAMEICDGQGADSGDILEMQGSTDLNEKRFSDINLRSNETLGENDHLSNAHVQTKVTEVELEESSSNDLQEIGVKGSTAGWFISEGEFALLAHDDGCCSLYDIVHFEEKAEYKPPVRVPMNIWGDCWIMRVAGIDGSLGKYVLAASAGNTKVSGFCAWDFYSKDVHACHLEDELLPSRTLIAPSSNSRRHIRDVLPSISPQNNVKWWYKPCSSLIAATASSQQTVKFFDVRDGEQTMKFETHKPVSSMEYCNPLQWRRDGRVVVAESDRVSLWDVNSLNPKPLVSVHPSDQKITALHIINADAEISKGVRRRAIQTGTIRSDGVFCNDYFVCLLDFRNPSGVGLAIPICGVDTTSVFYHGDTVFVGGSQQQSAGKKNSSLVQQFCLRKKKPVAVYPMPESDALSNQHEITQVWADSDLVMAVSSLGLGLYGRSKDSDYMDSQCGIVMGPSDMHAPSFDYASSRILIISRNRPALLGDLA